MACSTNAIGSLAAKMATDDVGSSSQIRHDGKNYAGLFLLLPVSVWSEATHIGWFSNL